MALSVRIMQTIRKIYILFFEQINQKDTKYTNKNNKAAVMSRDIIYTTVSKDNDWLR